MRFILLAFFISSFIFAKAQNIANNFVVVNDIIVSGNKKTNTKIVLREMLFKKGDTIDLNNLNPNIETSRNQIFNTTLFWDVKIETAKLDSNHISLIVLVKERWYVFPLPYFRLVDRNFNEWWVNQNHSLQRVDYGVKFYHNNVTGNNDKLTAEFITGYSRQVGVRYNLPYINKKMTNGINVGFVLAKQKELNVGTTTNNKQIIIKSVNGFLRTMYRFDVTFTNRPNLFARHNFRIAFTNESVDDYIVFKNSNYYGNYETQLNYVDVSYGYNYSKNNYNAYPTQGLSLSAGAAFRMFCAESNNVSASVLATYSMPLTKKMYMQNRVAALVKVPNTESFINQPLFGYSPFQMRGLEYYVVDGVAGLMHKLTLGYDFLNFKVKVPIKNKFINKVPFKIYAKVYNDFGYSYLSNANTFLNNKLLHTYGVGLDIITAYDIVFKLEYSFNQLGDKGFYVGLRD